MRFLTSVVLALMLLSFAGLASSFSKDDSALFARTRGKLEQLLGGAMGCADVHKPFAVRNRFDNLGSIEGTGGGVVSTGGRTNYPSAAVAYFGTRPCARWPKQSKVRCATTGLRLSRKSSSLTQV